MIGEEMEPAIEILLKSQADFYFYARQAALDCNHEEIDALIKLVGGMIESQGNGKSGS